MPHADDDRTHRAERFVAAPPGAVYDALVRAERLVRWLPPQGATGSIDVFEPRPGGRIQITLRFAASTGKSSADADVIDGTFVEIVPGERVVQAFTFRSPDPAFAGLMHMTWHLRPAPGGTCVQVSASDVPRGIDRAEHEQGMASTLSNLARFVEP